MGNLFERISGKDRNKARMDTFLEKSDHLSKKEQRDLERKMLKPFPLEKWSGEKPEVDKLISSRTVKIIFPSGRVMDLFRKHIRCAEFLGYNTVDTRMLIDFLKHLDDGRLIYNEKKRTFKYVEKTIGEKKGKVRRVVGRRNKEGRKRVIKRGAKVRS